MPPRKGEIKKAETEALAKQVTLPLLLPRLLTELNVDQTNQLSLYLCYMSGSRRV